MKQNLRKRLACLLLSALLLIGCLPVTALAAENGFILVAEAGGKLVIAPEYVPYTAGADRCPGAERQRTHLHGAGYRHDLRHRRRDGQLYPQRRER